VRSTLALPVQPPRPLRSLAGGAALALALPLLGGCNGGAPLLHPAHVLSPGKTMAGAGLSGQLPIRQIPATPATRAPLHRLTVAPGVAPWAGARVGLPASFEAGLTYTGRSVRADARHAFEFGTSTALSLGLGASVLMARRPGEGDDPSAVYGVGLDLPLLLGFRSRSDLYAFWFGPRAGIEFLSGRILLSNDPSVPAAEVSGRHVHAGFVVGARVGFRHVYVALELDGAYHRADGTFSGGSVGLDQFTLTPSGAIQFAF
jgi:hypothetical protein